MFVTIFRLIFARSLMGRTLLTDRYTSLSKFTSRLLYSSSVYQLPVIFSLWPRRPRTVYPSDACLSWFWIRFANKIFEVRNCWDHALCVLDTVVARRPPTLCLWSTKKHNTKQKHSNIHQTLLQQLEKRNRAKLKEDELWQRYRSGMLTFSPLPVRTPTNLYELFLQNHLHILSILFVGTLNGANQKTRHCTTLSVPFQFKYRVESKRQNRTK